MSRKTFCALLGKAISDEKKAGGSDYVALGSAALRAKMPASVRDTINKIASQELRHRDALERVEASYCKRKRS